MRNRPPRAWLVANGAAGIVAIVGLGVVLVRDWTSNRHWSYSAGEWLIGYDAGFTRRGLGGAVLLGLPGDARAAVVPLVWSLFATCCALLAVLVARAMAAVGSAWPLIVWLAPGGPLLGVLQGWWQPFGVVGSSFAFRKEFLAYVVMLLAALWLSRRPRNLWLGAAVTSMALLAVALVHEGAAVWAALAVIAMFAGLGRRALGPAMVVVFPVVLAAGWLASRPPLPGGSAERLWWAIDPTTRIWLGGAPPDAITFMEWGPGLIRGITQRVLIDSGLWRWWLVTAVLALVTTWAILYVADPRARWRPLLLLGVVGLAFATFALIAHDAGRWISVTVMIAVIVSLTWSAQSPAPHRLRPPRWAMVATVIMVVASAIAAFPVAGTPGGLLSR